MRNSGFYSTASAIIISVAMMSCLLTTSCNNNGCTKGSGGIVFVELDLEPFHTIFTENDFQVRIEQGSEQKVEVEGQQNIINEITTVVSDGIWLISLTGDCYENIDIVIRITIPTIQSIESTGADQVILNSFDSLDQLTVLVSGSGQFFQSGVLTLSDRLTLLSTGAGEMTANFITQRLEVVSSGSANMNLSGAATSQTVAVSGSGDYSAFGLTSNLCVIESSGSGNAEVTVSDEFEVNISGSGNVSYKGNPTITSNITGTGRLIDAN
jgi:Putative auto-transporter adhesin, head GIN domain